MLRIDNAHCTRLVPERGRICLRRCSQSPCRCTLGAAATATPANPGHKGRIGWQPRMSVAADDPSKAAARVSVVSTIGYGAFLCGPPLLGLLAEHVGILHSLLAVMAVLVVSFLLSPVARKVP